LLPAVLPLHPTVEQQRLLEAFYQVGEAYLQHIGQYVPERQV
jgi:hypothetical protein